MSSEVAFRILNAVYQFVTISRMLLGYVRDKSKPLPNPPLPTPMLQKEQVKKIGLRINNAIFKYDEYRDLYIKGAHECVRVLNSVEFRWAVLQAKFTETNGLTNKEIYDLIISGADKDREPDFMLDIYVHSYQKKNRVKKNRVLGYTYMSTYKTWINRRYLADLDPKRPDDVRHLAGHIAHEAMHNMGFMHNHDKYSSVPYVIGRIVRNLQV